MTETDKKRLLRIRDLLREAADEITAFTKDPEFQFTSYHKAIVDVLTDHPNGLQAGTLAELCKCRAGRAREHHNVARDSICEVAKAEGGAKVYRLKEE